MGATGRSDTGWLAGAIARSRVALAIGLMTALAFCLVQAAVASAILPSFTWSGAATVIGTEDWSEAAHWKGLAAPTSGEEIGALTFPQLTSSACLDEPTQHPCYFSYNDLTGLSAESLQLDDGNHGGRPYIIGGEALTLGSEGLTATPAAAGEAGDFLLLPLRLNVSQKWIISDRVGGGIEENGLLLAGRVSGSGALTAELANGAALILENDTEVGPVTLEGPNGTGEHINNGSVFLEGGTLNSSDHEPVNLRNVFFAGTGAVGALTSSAATIDVGSEADPEEVEPAGGLEATSVSLASTSATLFEIRGGGTVAQTDYSQMLSSGPVALAGVIGVTVGKPSESEPCPTLTPGSTYTLISTTGTLSGTFANAPEAGPEIAIESGKGCAQAAQKMRISYNRSGTTETVTGTVEAEALANQKLAEEQAKKVGEEAADVQAAAKKHQEEAAAAAAAKKREEEAKQGVLGSTEASPDATIASASLQANASGTVHVKISCPAGESSCTGTVALRTLNAVASRVLDAWNAKVAVLTLATGSFNVPGGQAKTITLHLSARARKLLAHRHLLRVRVTVAAHNPAGATHTAQSTVTLRLQKAGHGNG
jgi:hypothetical protein